MSQSRQHVDAGILVRFWSLDHHSAEDILWPASPWPKVVFAVEGVLQVQTASQVHLIPSNRALFVPAGEKHPARTLGKAKVRTIYFAPHLSVEREQHVFEVRPLFRELIAEACRIGPLSAKHDRDPALTTLLIHEVRSAPKVATTVPMPKSEWLKEWALEFLENPLIQNPIGYSNRTMERRVLSETSLTLGQWRQQARALVGLRELSQGSTVVEAAIAAGFDTSSGFIQSFRKQFGDTPARMARLLRSHPDS